MSDDTPSPLNNVITIDDERIKSHLDRVVRGTVEEALNALLDAEADRLCNAQRYERSETRRDTRAGHYERGLQTKAGEVRLRVPKLRRQAFETAIIERYRRRESSVEEALIEIVAMHNPPASFTELRRRIPVVRPDPGTALGRAAAEKQTVQIVDVRAAPAYRDAPADFNSVHTMTLGGARTVVAVPMLKERELVGAVVIYRQEVRPFTDKQIELVSNFASRPSSLSRTHGCSRNYGNARMTSANPSSSRPPPPIQGHQPLDVRSPTGARNSDRERDEALRRRAGVHL